MFSERICDKRDRFLLLKLREMRDDKIYGLAFIKIGWRWFSLWSATRCHQRTNQNQHPRYGYKFSPHDNLLLL